jgi:plasmid stabilization system protein ParE
LENPDAARRAIARIRGGVLILRENPGIGRPAENMQAGYREWLIQFGSGVYVVLYQVEGSTVAVLAIRHGRELGY